MDDQVTVAESGSSADAADSARFAEALQRLLPAVERFTKDQEAAQFPAYAPGTIPSELVALPHEGVGLDATLDEIAIAIEHGSRIGAPGFLGFITTSGTTAAVAAQTAAAVAGGQRYLIQSFNALEHTALRWLADLCGLPVHASGVFTSGGSTAQLLGLGAARQWAFEQRGIDVAADGVPADVRGRIYVSRMAHRTIHRSAAVLGVGRNNVVEVAASPSGHIDLRALDDALRRDTAAGVVPIAVIPVAGSTDTGSVDPVQDVVEIGRRYGAWVHVDGAYGLLANASPVTAPLLAGVADADSWIVDPHKWLSTGVGVGAAYVRDRDVLTRAFTEGHAAYLDAFARDAAHAASQFDLIGGDWADTSMELSAPPRGVMVWAVLREIGRAGVADRIERHIGFAQHVANRVRAESRLELIVDAQLSIVCFRYRPPVGFDGAELNDAILGRLRRETRFIPTTTVVDGVLAIRPCFINPRTRLEHVDGLVDAVARFGDELTQ